MAMSSWMIRRQNLRTGTSRSRKQGDEDIILSECLQKEPNVGFREILDKLCRQDEDEKLLLTYLNVFVRVFRHYEDKLESFGFRTNFILSCLRLSLMHQSTKIRSAGLRCIRHTIKCVDDIIFLNTLLTPFLISRSFDLYLKIDVERTEAMKLMRKMLILAPAHFHISMARSLVSLANEGTEGKDTTEGKDRMLRICLATLCEIGVLNSKLFITCGGVAAITRNLIECQTPKIAESLCGVLLLLLDKPSTRHQAAVDLHSVAAPFCDFHYKHCWKDKNRRDERELRLNCSRLALLTILRSWPGILHFCSPMDRGGFRSIVEVLYLDQLEVRKAVLDLLYELLGLPQPEWTDEVSVALSAVDPCEPQATWRLKEGFVVAEGRSILPSLVRAMPSVTDVHLALLLYCFQECGLLGALTEVIVTSDTFISVRATILLGEILRLIQILLPPGCCNLSPSLPNLLEYATKNKPQAMGAITALQQLHKLMKNRPASYSLHLDYILRNSYNKRLERLEQKQEKSVRHRSTLKSKLNQVKSVLKDGDDIVKDTGVLSSNDAYTWNWKLIQLLLKGEYNAKIDLMDSSHKTFLKKLIEFFMPSQNKYSHMDLGMTSSVSIDHTISGIDLINFLVSLEEPEYQSMVLELFNDILNNILAITSSSNVHNCLFSPQHMANTQCQSYFLFIGQLARSASGLKLLKSIEMFTILKELATTTNHDCYVKLIIASMDYSQKGPSRDILEAILNCKIESSRLYATQFLLILLRAGSPDFANWAISLLVKQLNDCSRSVFLSALSTLQEACELPDCLDALIDIDPDLSKMGEKGKLLSIRFLSTEAGFKKWGTEKAMEEINQWSNGFLCRYVKITEMDISDVLTLHQRMEDGQYEKRISNVRSNARKDVFLPAHLCGQLNQHQNGFELLVSTGFITILIEVMKKSCQRTEEDIIKLKSAIWALGHLSTSNIGFECLRSNGIIDEMISLVRYSPIYSIRATAFYALGLIATTELGADELSQQGWLAVKHDRHDSWPVIKDELQDAVYLNQYTMSLSDESASADNPFLTDLENIERRTIDTSESYERLDIFSSPMCSPDLRKMKQLTLPASRNVPEILHKRSLSESKTFDTSNGYEDLGPAGPFGHMTRRERNSSMTESTTSGVSSCDSLQNKHTACLNYLKTLSPIPSSSSLSTLKLPPNLKRNSCRVSSNSATGSDISTSSLTGSTSNELSFQNLIGYNTIRYLRRSEEISFEKQDDGYLFKPPPHSMIRRPTVVGYFDKKDRDLQVKPLTTFNIQTLNLLLNWKHEDRTFMGICLPRFLTDMFPNEEELHIEPRVSPDELSVAFTEIRRGPSDSQFIQHSVESCFCCCKLVVSRHSEESVDENLKMELLSNIERLANPVLNKSVRSYLLRLKQREPDLFKDICIYSEVCKMLSEISYRLSIRRLLHELFYEVNYNKVFETTQRLFGLPQKVHRESLSLSSPTEFKTLDSLRLICNDNKFPIKKKS